jgi:hypothetical protein
VEIYSVRESESTGTGTSRKKADSGTLPELHLPDAVDHPAHYTFGKLEVIDVIEDWNLGFSLGNVIKYVARAEHKGKQLEDLRKARFYLDRRIAQLQKGTE